MLKTGLKIGRLKVYILVETPLTLLYNYGKGVVKMKYVGEKYGKMTIIESWVEAKFVGGKTQKIKKRTFAKCRCECGNTSAVARSDLTSGNTSSCGCLINEMLVKRNFKHGFGKHPVKGTYYSMINRCTNPKKNSYKDYGGRGIKVCDEWLNSIESFVKWAEANGYKKGLHIDRINNDGNYEPSNCKFVTCAENQTHKRDTVYFNGTFLKEALERLSSTHKIPFSTLRYRYYRMKNNNIEPTVEMLINYKSVKTQ